MTSWRWLPVVGVLGALLVLSALGVIFQDNLTRFLINPRTPYQTYVPPPPPAYSARGAWAIWPSDQRAHNADVFYVHSTTYASPKHWNSPLLASESERALFRAAAPNEAGPFMLTGAVYGPRYRQATLYAEFTHKFDGLAARKLAYQDVENAFVHFLKSRPEERPFILVGYGQGGLHVLGLLQQHVAIEDTLRKQLAAAYVINSQVPMRLFQSDLQTIPPCTRPEQPRCVISYVEVQTGLEGERNRYKQRALEWDEEMELVSFPNPDMLCTNPITWSVSNEYVSADQHKGAASATGFGTHDHPPSIARAVSAQCVDGILMVNKPRQPFLQKRHWFGDHWRAQDFNLFYEDLAHNAAERVRQLQLLLEEELLETSDQSQDFPSSQTLEEDRVDLLPGGDDKDDE